MFIWRLRPRSGSGRDWLLSRHAGPVVIRAADEARARAIATIAFGVTDRSDPALRDLRMPWQDAGLSSCDVVEGDEYDSAGEEAVLEPGGHDSAWRSPGSRRGS